MKINNKEILDVMQGLVALTQEKIPLNIKTSYVLARNKKTLSSYVDIIKEKQIELYRKWGTEDDEHNITVPKDKIPELEQDLDELFTIDNQISLITLKLEDFGEVELPFDILEKLLPIIEE